MPYIHMGGKVGVLVNLAVEGIADMAKVVELGKDVAMQICAMNPTFLDKSDVDQATLDKEKEILMVQAKEDPQECQQAREYHREDGHGPHWQVLRGELPAPAGLRQGE